MISNGDEADRRAIPRLVPEEPFPPYAYVTGHFPHPIRDPAGHHFGVAAEPCPQPDPSHWRDSRPYLHGLDLFNHGYYWEAHEVWESIWHACGRVGQAASLMKGLIKLAAAGVKVREGRPDGVRRHARRAAELFREVAGQLLPGQTRYFGVSLADLIERAARIERDPVPTAQPESQPVEIVFPFVLRVDDEPTRC